MATIKTPRVPSTIEAPVFPLEIWAKSDLVLPNSGRQNKVRPIDDLWQKGWDKGQKPDCEAFNYLLNLYGQWLQYVLDRINSENTDFLEIAKNLADVLDKAEARKNLDVYSKGEAANAFVNVEGDTMTGPLALNRINFTGSHATDFFYVECNYTGTESSHLDFVFGDNALEDQIRFRGRHSNNGSIFNIMTVELSPDKDVGKVAIYDTLEVYGSIKTPALDVTQGNFVNMWASNEGVFGAIRCRETTINTSGTTTNYLRVNGECNTTSLVVNNNWAVVAGRHVVRTVNGAGADANGAVWISAGVQDIRFGGIIVRGHFPDDWVAPLGEVVCGLDVDRSTSVKFYTRNIQKLVDGTWYNVGG